MERNIKLVLAYDGTDFHGWQRQADVRTVQEEVEKTLMRILRHPLHVKGASRTDAGVHARGQVANVRTTATIPVPNLLRAIGHHLPPDIALVHVEQVSASFHSALCAVGKLYRYRIFNAESRPVERFVNRNAWHVWYPLDLERLRAGGAEMVGEHDFAGFASQGSPRATTVRTVSRVGVRRRGPEVLIDVEGTGFLYNQVRNMVGTLFEIGRGRWEPSRVRAILDSGDRGLAGLTAPAHGLCLQWVRYDPAERLSDDPE